MSKRTGLAIDFLQKLKHAAELGGASLGDFDVVIRRLSQGALDASRGLKSANQDFDLLGVTIRAQNGELKTSEELFMDVAKALAGVQNSTERVAIATRLLGRSGSRVLPMLTDWPAPVSPASLSATFTAVAGRPVPVLASATDTVIGAPANTVPAIGLPKYTTAVTAPEPTMFANVSDDSGVVSAGSE
jgi:hypothetical protein